MGGLKWHGYVSCFTCVSTLRNYGSRSAVLFLPSVVVGSCVVGVVVVPCVVGVVVTTCVTDEVGVGCVPRNAKFDELPEAAHSSRFYQMKSERICTKGYQTIAFALGHKESGTKRRATFLILLLQLGSKKPSTCMLQKTKRSFCALVQTLSNCRVPTRKFPTYPGMCTPQLRAARRTDGMAACTAASESVAAFRNLRRRTERRDHNRLRVLLAVVRNLRRRTQRYEDAHSRVHDLRIRNHHGGDTGSCDRRHELDHCPLQWQAVAREGK